MGGATPAGEWMTEEVVTRAVVVAVLVALASPATAGSSPRVRTVSSHCTTEPVVDPPDVKVLKTKRRGELRVRVIGAGHYCAAGWSASITDGAITLTADDSVDAPACLSTCAIILRITGLSRGTRDVTLDGVTIHARIR